MSIHRSVSPKTFAGFTLTEIMLALAISSLTIIGALQLFAVGRSGYQATENLARLEERAAFVLTALTDDIQRAGYWGMHNDGSRISVPPHIMIHCRGINVASWAAQTAHAIVPSDGIFNLPCPAATNAVAASDTLTLRYASAAPTNPESGRIQIHTNTVDGTLFSNGLPPALPKPGETHDLRVHAWYLDTQSSEPPLPALRRYALTSGGLMQNQEIMPGVESLQIQLGIDQNADNVLDSFVEPGQTAGEKVMAVRIWLLLRSQHPDPGHIDNGPWKSTDSELPAYVPADNFRRIAVERTVMLRNTPAAL